MMEGYDPNAIYFHFPFSAKQIGLALTLVASSNAVFDLSIPLEVNVMACTVGMLAHNLIWNTLHCGTHELKLEYEDGLPCLPYPTHGSSIFSPYVQWVFDNHTTHHDLGGKYNYNVVCPGPDFILGTYKHRSEKTCVR